MTIKIEYFSDVLCIWAYGGQIRLDELKHEFGDDIDIHYRFLPIFAATRQHIQNLWQDRDGFAGFSRHVIGAAQNWEHITVHPDIWQAVVPESSRSAHVYLKAIQLLALQGEISDACLPQHAGRTVFEQAIWRFRDAFFQQAQDIATREIQDAIATELELPVYAIHRIIDCGQADAALHMDDEASRHYRIPGSPTLVLNEGRQLLYGNIGYRILEANVRELQHNHLHGEASWC